MNFRCVICKQKNCQSKHAKALALANVPKWLKKAVEQASYLTRKFNEKPGSFIELARTAKTAAEANDLYLQAKEVGASSGTLRKISMVIVHNTCAGLYEQPASMNSDAGVQA